MVCSSLHVAKLVAALAAHKKSPADAGLFVSESAALRVVRMRRLNLETLLSLKDQPLSPVSLLVD
jgi:hypothetical protein